MSNTHIRQPRIDHINRTITVTKTFMDVAADYSTEEFKLIRRLLASCRGYEVVIAKHRKPKTGEKRLTYVKMRKYIECLRDSAAILEHFEKVVAFSKTQPNPYRTVSVWFNESFPDYGCFPSFDADGFPEVETNIVPFEKYKTAHQEQTEQLSTAVEQEQSENEQLRAS